MQRTLLSSPWAAALCAFVIAFPGVATAVPTRPLTSTPTLVGVRAAHHAGFDEVVFQFRGGTPPHARLRYVHHVTADGSGAPVRVRGRHFAEVTFSFAQAHRPDGRPSAPTSITPLLPNVRQVKEVGDFEGYVSYALGLRHRVRLRTTAFTGRSRYVIDVPVSASR